MVAQRLQLRAAQEPVLPPKLRLQPTVETLVVQREARLDHLDADAPARRWVANLPLARALIRQRHWLVAPQFMQRCIRREAQLGAAASERQSQDPVDDLQRLRVRRLGVRQIRAEISVEVQDGIEIAPKQPQLVLELCLREREQHQHLPSVRGVLARRAHKRQLLRVDLERRRLEARARQPRRDRAHVVRITQPHHLHQLLRRHGLEDTQAVGRQTLEARTHTHAYVAVSAATLRAADEMVERFVGANGLNLQLHLDAWLKDEGVLTACAQQCRT